MNLLLIRVSLIAAASHKTLIRGFATAAGKLESEMPSRRGDCVTYYTLITDELSRAVELLDSMRRGLSPSKTTSKNYTSLINSLSKHDDRIDEADRVFIEMILSGFSPSVFTLNDVVCGFLRIGEMKGHYYNTLISEMCKAEELSHAVQLLDHMRRLKGLTPNETTFTSLIDFLCKHDDTINDAYMVFNEMFLSGFSPSSSTLNNVFIGLIRIGETEKAYEMFIKMKEHKFWMKMNSNRYLLLKRGFYHGNAYTNLMNAYLDEDKLLKVDQLRYHMGGDINCLPSSVINSVFINGLDNKARTTNTKMYLLRFNYDYCLFRIPTLEYRRTLAVNCSDDEFKSLVELVEGFCNRGLENAHDTMLKWNYKPDGIVYNLFIIVYCKCFNVHQAYNIYKEMVHYGFACHMFTLFPLIRTLKWNDMFNELRWVVQNVLRSCNLNDSEILQFLDEFNPKEPDSEALFNVLAEKAKDGLFLKCSYAPPSV